MDARLASVWLVTLIACGASSITVLRARAAPGPTASLRLVESRSDTKAPPGLFDAIDDALSKRIFVDPNAGDVTVRFKVVGYNEGNKAARVLVGFGAGATSIEVLVDYLDRDGRNIATIRVSDVLSGGNPWESAPKAMYRVIAAHITRFTFKRVVWRIEPRRALSLDSAPPTSSPLSREEVIAIANAAQPALENCIVGAAAGGGVQPGSYQLTASWTVNAAGRVESMSMRPPPGIPEAAVSCVTKTIREMRFRAAGRQLPVKDYSFDPIEIHAGHDVTSGVRGYQDHRFHRAPGSRPMMNLDDRPTPLHPDLPWQSGEVRAFSSPPVRGREG